MVLTQFGVSTRDVLVFSVYAALGLALPGFVLFRLLMPRSASFVTDVVLGVSLAYAVELFVYIAAAATGHPGYAWVWPVVPVLVSLLPGLRKQVWHRSQERMPWWWAWSMAGLVLFAVQWFARYQWTPVHGRSLRFPYLDEPYHQALVAALRHQVPTDLPFLRGEPLHYHWFVHADLSSATHATGIEPLIILQRVGLLPMVVVVLMGSAILVQRLSGSVVAGVVAPIFLTVAAVTDIPPHFGQTFLTRVIYLSPTTTFAHVLLIGCLAVSLHLLGDGSRASRRSWVVAALMLAALSGSKGSILPIIACGYVASLVLALLVRRKVFWRPLALLGLSVAALLLAQRYVYGSTTGGLQWGPFETSVVHALGLGMGETASEISPTVQLTLAGLFVVTVASCGVGIVGLLSRGHWRDARAHFLVGAAAAGFGATMLLQSPGNNQLYFVRVTPVFVAVAGAWGLAVLFLSVPRKTAVRAVVVSVAGGTVLAYLAQRLTAPGFVDPSLGLTWTQLVLPIGVASLVVAVSGMIVVALTRRRSGLGRLPALCVACLILGLSVPYGIGELRVLVTDPHRAAAAVGPENKATIGVGGIRAARWLRAHATEYDVVATNAHCRLPSDRVCDSRAFWMAAYSERPFLLEGWAYTSQTGARALELEKPGCCIPFWDVRLQRDNDEVFKHPSAKAVRTLRDRHDVRWLLVDRRFRLREARLRQFTELMHEGGDYAVYRVPANS